MIEIRKLTNALGNVRFAKLPDGTPLPSGDYTIRVTKQGYKPKEVDVLGYKRGTTRSVTIQLEPA